jgi:hypothetical protein
MAKQPFTWQPEDVIEVTNVSGENFILHLDSGELRLDAGRTLRMTASTLDQHHIVQLVNAGKLQIQDFNWKKRR